MKSFDLSLKAFVGFLLAVTVYVTVFDGDISVLKNKALQSVPGVATSLSVLLPTTSIKPTPTRSSDVRTDTSDDLVNGTGSISVQVIGGAEPLADCATAPVTVACEWKTTQVPVSTATPYLGTKPELFIDPELLDATPIAIEPVLEVAFQPVSNVLSTTADYRSDCHAMFSSREDKSTWIADIAACTATGDYK